MMLSQKDKFFSTDHLKSGLKERAVKSAGITLAAQGIKLTLQLGSVAVMARLLQPSDFGLIAMVTVFTGLALQFMEGGLSMATIQRDQITHGQVSNLFWVNVALGAGLCALGILISPLIAHVYDEPRITLIMTVMSLAFLIGGISVQHDAILKRQMRFRTISLIDITSMALGIIAGIVSAFSGLKYWSLVIGSITTYFTKTIFRWISVQWVPSLMQRGTGVRPLLSFGANLTGANFIGYFVNNVTSFAVGYIGGAQSLGFYNRANTLTSIPSKQLLPPLMQVMQSALTRVQNDPTRLRTAALSLMTKISIVTMLVTISMFITSDWLVLVILGPEWGDVVDIFRILAISTIVTPITTFTAVIMVAVGQAKALMRWKAITLAILLVSIVIGSYWGAIGIILAYCISGIFVRMPGFLIYSTKYQPIRSIDYFRSLRPVFLCAMVTLTIVMWLRSGFSFNLEVLSIIFYFLVTTIIYVSLLCIFKLTRSELKDGIDMAMGLLVNRT